MANGVQPLGSRFGVSREHLAGDVPDPADPPPGCRFHTRCPFATEQCRIEDPALRDFGTDRPHTVACHRVEELEPLSGAGPDPSPTSEA